MNYQSALKFLDNFSNYEKEAHILKPRFSLAPIKTLLSKIDDPHKKFKVVHVAGTVGKGSVAHMLTSALTVQGYRTGLFTSPHLNDIRERIRINNRLISKKIFAESVSNIIGITKNDFSRFSYFEMLTAVAFDVFYKADVDIAIIEAGLGGRLDSTNVVDPVISVITKIGWDHMHVLGDSIKEISREKAGIIKKGRDVVISHQHYIAERELLRKCKAQKSRCYFSRPDQIIFKHRDDTDFYSFKYMDDVLSDIEIPWKGSFQKENFATFIRTLEILSLNHIDISKESLVRSLGIFSLNGRFQKIELNDKLSVILDGAHNKTAAKTLSNELESYFPDQKKVMIIGIMKDKDSKGILKMLRNSTNTIISTGLNYERALKSNVLFNISKNYFDRPYKTENISEAISLAGKVLSGKGVIVVTGSLYAVAEAREFLIK